jgi:phosphoglycolate phosphatase-like HAD superfamily hydrolase
MIRVVVFDFDGTLVDSNGVKRACMEATVAGIPGGSAALAAARTLGGDRYVLFGEVARLLDPSAPPQMIAARSRELVADYSRCCARGIVAARERRGARRMLAALKARGLRLWVNSATPQRHLPELLHRRGLMRFLDGARGGPTSKSEILRNILSTERVRPREVMFVGDGPDDAAAAQSVGTWFIAIAAEKRMQGRHLFAFRDLTKLVALIDRFSGRPGRRC